MNKRDNKWQTGEIAKTLLSFTVTAYIGFSVVLIYILVGQVDLYADYAGTSEAIANFQKNDYRLYEFQVETIPPEMESLVTLSPRHVSRYDIGARRLMESYNRHMIIMYSHCLKSRQDALTPNASEQIMSCDPACERDD